MVRITGTGAAALMAAAAVAAPVNGVDKRQALTDADILQFALTLEHLENVFYVNGLNQFPESEFLNAGFSKEYYDNLKYVAHDEEQHVLELTAGLTAAGASPVKACTYDFPYKDPKGFVTLASVVEGVGSAAYLGAAPAITNKEYLTIAGSILVTEALHTSLQRFAIGEIAAANPYGSYLTPNAIYTLVAPFIKSCPASNGALPFMAFPTLTATQGIPAAPGITFTFTTTATMPANFFITFICGLDTISMPATVSGGMITATIPDSVSGQTYAIATSVNTTSLSDSQVIAGPAILEVTPPAPDFAIAP